MEFVISTIKIVAHGKGKQRILYKKENDKWFGFLLALKGEKGGVFKEIISGALTKCLEEALEDGTSKYSNGLLEYDLTKITKETADELLG